jgi:flagellar motility protein MotE (MotC chaperone)
MSVSKLKLLIGAKALLLLGLGGYFGKDYIKAQVQKQLGQSASTPSTEAVKLDASGLPQIPTGEITLSEAVEIRTQLEFLKKDAENRIAELTQAKKSYEVAKTGVEEKLKQVEEDRRLLDESLQKEKKVKEERLNETIEFLSKMDPRKAASVLESMDRDLVITLFKKMPARFVTKTMESMSPKKAVEFMEYYTRIRSGREYSLMKELGLCKPDDAEDGASTPATKQSTSPAEPQPTPSVGPIATPTRTP